MSKNMEQGGRRIHIGDVLCSTRDRDLKFFVRGFHMGKPVAGLLDPEQLLEAKKLVQAIVNDEQIYVEGFGLSFGRMKRLADLKSRAAREVVSGITTLEIRIDDKEKFLESDFERHRVIEGVALKQRCPFSGVARLLKSRHLTLKNGEIQNLHK